MLRHINPLAGLFASTFLMMTATGLTNILLPLRAGLEGWSPITVGWMGSFYSACFVAGCIIVPRLVLRVGHVRVFSVLASLLCISLLVHSMIVSVPMWLFARGIGGFALAGAYMVAESWLNEQATNETRGSVFSIYMVINTVGLMAGQFLLITGDPSTTWPFILAALLYSMAVIPTGLTSAISPQPLTEVRLNLKRLIANSPVAMLGAFVMGSVFGAWAFQSPIYGSLAGLNEAGIATLLAIAMIGGAIGQLPIGWLSDRMDRRVVMLGTIGALIVVAAIFIVLNPSSFRCCLCWRFCLARSLCRFIHWLQRTATTTQTPKTSSRYRPGF